MNKILSDFFAKVKSYGSTFQGLDSSDINAVACDGENALHLAVSWSDIDAARSLIEAGIDLNRAGDLGYTPLHEASAQGKVEFVKLLVESGADVHALTEGYPPYALARMGRHDDICDYLRSVMEARQKDDPFVWEKSRIRHLRAEIARLERIIAGGARRRIKPDCGSL